MAYFVAASGLFWILILVGAGFLVYALLRGLGAGAAATMGSAGPTEDPAALAAARYARGEIGRDEYLQIRQDLAAPPAGVAPAPGSGERP